MAVNLESRTAAHPRLLVVDDDDGVLRIVERLAAGAGFDVETRGNGADALRALVQRSTDLAMIDLRMPDRVVVRLTEEAAAARLESLKKKPMRGKGVET